MSSIPIGTGKNKYIPDPPGMKYCKRCKQLRAVTQFAPSKTSSDGLAYKCRPCINAYKTPKNRAKQKAKSWLKYYGITPDQYQALFDEQSGVCAICGCSETKRIKGTLTHLSVDHDHVTGAIRGLLCSSCNEGLGRFKDDTVRMERAITYLRRSRE